MAKASITIDVKNMPEMIHSVMRECAKRLRDEADSEADPRVAQRLREIAASFEAGQ
jgi:two-component sensor histidine kinase